MRGNSLYDARPVLLVNGILLMILACAMLIPALIDHWHDHEDSIAFLSGFAITFAVGMALYLMNRGYTGALSVQQAFILTTSVWFVVPLFAAIPLCYSTLNLGLVDAFFETTSGLTTTGASIIADVESAPPGVLMWRSLMNWLGGIGIIVLAVAILPMLRIGGMQLFKTESSDVSEKVLPRAKQIASVIGTLYINLTLLCAFCYWLADMTGFDAINHAMSTIATGGFSTKNASIGHFDSASIETISIFFMILGSLPFLLFYRFVKGDTRALLNDVQVHWFFGILAGCIALTTLWLALTAYYTSPWQAFRHAAFNVTSILSTTGFASTDYNLWGSFAVGFMFLISVTGGCTGSTTGGVKIFRLIVLVEMVKIQMAHLIRPHAVLLPKFNGRTLDPAVPVAVMGFCLLWAVVFMVSAALLSFLGVDFLTSMSGTASALANVGPGLGPIIGPVGNFSTLPDAAKIILSVDMIIGRLELFTVLILFTPMFWKD